jgi:hypothetical protein
MAGYADALASVLYPNSAANSMYTLGGQGLAKMQLPTFESPWQNALANAMQGLGAAGLQAYGIYSTNKANAENAAAMIPEMSKMGVNVSPEVAGGLSSENPQTRALALALTEQRMKAQETAAAQEAEFAKFKRQEELKKGLDAPQKNYDNESKLRGELEKPLAQFQTSTRIFGTMIDAADKDDKIADISLISGIAKMRDPESAVMQGEFNVNTDTASWLEKQFGNVRSVVDGKGRLSPETRAKMLAAAQDYWENSRQQYEFAAVPRVDMARRQQMNPDNVLMVPYEKSAYESILSKMPNVGAPAASPTMPPAVAGPSPDGSSVRMAPPPSDNVGLPYNLPPLPAGQEYRMSPEGIVIVRK